MLLREDKNLDFVDDDFALRDEIEEAVKKYAPLVKATAHRYTGRGAEFEDLVQEGYLAIVRLVPV